MPTDQRSQGEQIAQVLAHFVITQRRTVACEACQGAPKVVEVTHPMGMDELVLACLEHWRSEHRRRGV